RSLPTVISLIGIGFSPFLFFAGILSFHHSVLYLFTAGLTILLISQPFAYLWLKSFMQAALTTLLGLGISAYIGIWVFYSSISMNIYLTSGLFIAYFGGMIWTCSTSAHRNRMPESARGKSGIVPFQPGKAKTEKIEAESAKEAPRAVSLDDLEEKKGKEEDLVSGIPRMEPFEFIKSVQEKERASVSAQSKGAETASGGPSRRIEDAGRSVGSTPSFAVNPEILEDLFREFGIPSRDAEDRIAPDLEDLVEEETVDMKSPFIEGKDLYEILRIPRYSDTKAVRRAYRRLAMKYHPDLNPDIGGEYTRAMEDEMKRINTAKEVLIHPGRKKYYDRILREY
ncbi:MAG: J domain-containing protein, partial [Deltaproteobacteria bacterium]